MNIPLLLLFCLITLITGYVIGRLHARHNTDQSTEILRQELQKTRHDNEQLHEENRRLQQEIKTASTRQAAAEARLETERIHTEKTLKAQAAALREEFRNIASETVRHEGTALRNAHIHSLESLLSPLEKDIADFRTHFIKGHADIGRHIHDLIEQTSAVGKEANDLAKALRGNTKLQGNWGEAVLKNLLETSGLTEGRDFTTQENTHDEEGHRLIPDVVVHLPEQRDLIIDSKVSLTAFTRYVAEENPVEATLLLKEHVASVRRHIRELSDKQYDKVVKDSIGYVLMFIPSEPAYVSAVMAEPNLMTEAYSRHVILINPTNLLMALQLAYNLWQSELQSRSVREIYDSAEKLYKKFATFSKSFMQIGQNIQTLSGVYDKAQKQLSTGRGNIVTQLEGWKKKGLTPSVELPSALLQDESPEEEDEETEKKK